MRILLISHYYTPEPVEMVHDLARGLVRLGHDVQVVTSFPCYPEGKTYAGYQQQTVQRETLDGVQILRVPHFPDHSRSAFRRAAYYFSFAATATAIGGAAAAPADVVLVYQAELPVGLAGWAVARMRRIPCAYYVVDLWPESATASGMINNPAALRLVQAAAKMVYRRADFVAAGTAGFGRRLKEMGIPEERLSVIHNWMPDGRYDAAQPDAALAEKEGLAGKFNVMYAGNIGVCQGLSPLVEAAALLRDLPDVQLVFVGSGVEHEMLVALAQRHGLENVRFLGRRPPDMMSPLYALADALVVHLQPNELSDITVPSKTFAYMQSGKPVLMAVGGEAAEFVTQNGFGLAVPPSTPTAIAGAVRQLRSMSPAERAQMGEHGRSNYRQKYSATVQVGRMEAMLQKAVANSR